MLAQSRMARQFSVKSDRIRYPSRSLCVPGSGCRFGGMDPARRAGAGGEPGDRLVRDRRAALPAAVRLRHVNGGDMDPVLVDDGPGRRVRPAPREAPAQAVGGVFSSTRTASMRSGAVPFGRPVGGTGPTNPARSSSLTPLQPLAPAGAAGR